MLHSTNYSSTSIAYIFTTVYDEVVAEVMEFGNVCVQLKRETTTSQEPAFMQFSLSRSTQKQAI